MSALPAFANAHATCPPRQFMHAPAVTLLRSAMLMPQQRLQRLAVRRSFVNMKRLFVDAVSRVEGGRGDWLRRQVRQTEAPVDLWLLRGAVFDALRHAGDGDHSTRDALRQALESSFPES